MRPNARRTLRISLAVPILSGLLFAQCAFSAQTYTVRKGDTLYGIAKRLDTSVSAIQKANHLKTSIKIGTVLTIPVKAAPPADPVTYGRATLDSLAVRSEDKVIATLPKDARFVVLAREGDRFNIKLEDGKTGWVQADAVVLEDTRKPLPITDTWGIKKSIVQKALAYRGARYRRGGMSSRGFDCSGFVKYLYATRGIKLPHDSRAMYKFGTRVAKSDLQPGDILFFVNTYRRGISHVGLYIGEGKFIHASTYRRGVRVDSLDAEYYRRHYYAAKRI